jgi:hypothetical protein
VFLGGLLLSRTRNLVNELMVGQAANLNRFVSQPEEPTEKLKPLSRSSKPPLFRPEDLGEHPPLGLLMRPH